MSRYSIPFSRNGEKIEVLCGYDRPLDRFFLVIDRPDCLDDDLAYIYSNLRDHPTGDMTLDEVREESAKAGFPVPEDILEQMEKDRKKEKGEIWG